MAELEAFAYAMESYTNHQRFPNLAPRPGSLRDQPEMWMMAIACVEAAVHRAQMMAADFAAMQRKQEAEEAY